MLRREDLCPIFAANKRSMIDKNEISTLKAVLLYIINGWNGTQKCDVYHIVKAMGFTLRNKPMIRHFEL